MTITITLPFPDSKLMPNRKNGTHWASTVKEKEKAKNDGYYAAIGYRNKQFKSGVKIMFYCPDRLREYGKPADITKLSDWFPPSGKIKKLSRRMERKQATPKAKTLILPEGYEV